MACSMCVFAQHCGPISADDHFLSLEPRVRVTREPATPEFDQPGSSLRRAEHPGQAFAKIFVISRVV
jgi:hypothetical protein